ncbi:nucleotide exchange factor GrpE [Neorhodopirellula pilleata]|uniref:Protein GrpE n=1 Tax=Neorhodopirellula pilleata TaxID=2714738 RepID=A0A5C6ATQ4_9BACT|nr:nucleotide exchange factor GrpE [Neorhodopirellula pilleata]TWU01524.1 heat shock protein GrpE [Neorhodopirellula pilleata]
MNHHNDENEQDPNQASQSGSHFDSDQLDVRAATDQAYESFDESELQDSAPETRDEEMERLRGEVVAADKRVLQAQADAENFRKRMRRDYEDQLKFAPMAVVADVLQVRDNLIRAIEAASASSESESLREGVAMVAKQLDDALAKHGVEPIPAEGEVFDPNVHEAISQMPTPDIDEGKVAHVAVTGFRMHGRVLRPAQVVVSMGSGG